MKFEIIHLFAVRMAYDARRTGKPGYVCHYCSTQFRGKTVRSVCCNIHRCTIIGSHQDLFKASVCFGLIIEVSVLLMANFCLHLFQFSDYEDMSSGK